MSTVVNLAAVGIMRLWPLWLCCLWLPVSTVSAAKLESPPGFSVEALPFSVPNARQMALTPGGHLIVGTRRKGRVYAVINALEDDNPRVVTLLNKLDMPSGVAMLGSDLYIAALSRVLRISDIDNQLHDKPHVEVVSDDLPTHKHHGWKYIKFGSDGQLYIPVGAPCNICLSKDPRYATLLRMDPSSGKTTLVARGIRNIVGMDWHPTSGDLWVSNNGRDMLGDDIPADELNVIPADLQEPLHYGYPFVHSVAAHEPDGTFADPKFGDHVEARQHSFEPARWRIQAHSAPLGMRFYTGSQFPSAYRQGLFVAEHGSWNRSSKVGYQVSVLMQDDEGRLDYRPFITGWLEGERAQGRPNDVLQTPDGSLLISDDQGGKIFRVRYRGQTPVEVRSP